MNYREFGRLGWKVSEIGYGMWGMGGWTNSKEDESLSSLQDAVDLTTIIPGMRRRSHVQSNIAASDAGPLPAELHEKLKSFRWARKPAPWSW